MSSPQADRDILDALASLAAPFVQEMQNPPGEASTLATASSHVASENAAPLPERSAKAIETRLQSLLAEAPSRPLGVILLRFAGLDRLPADAAGAMRDQFAPRVRACIDAEGDCGWSGPEDLVLVSAKASTDPSRLAERVVAAVRPLLARLFFADEIELDLRVGTSRTPQDGSDAQALIETAAERAG